MDSINWDALGAIGDFAGSIGVFISLVYLAFQTKQATAETRDASIHSVMELAIKFRSESYTGDLAPSLASSRVVVCEDSSFSRNFCDR